MPIRIIREGILRSEKVNKLSAEAEVFYRRLLSVIDDFGRYSASPVLLRSACYPLRIDTVKDKQIEKWAEECISAELMSFYEASGKKYIQVHNTNPPRANKSRFPNPENICLQTQTSESTCLRTCSAPNTNTNTIMTSLSIELNEYLINELIAYNKLISDLEYIEERKKYHPGMDILLSLEKAHIDYWHTEAGWKKKKPRTDKAIDWKATYTNALTIKSNQVWIQKNQYNSKFGRQEVDHEEVKKNAEKTLELLEKKRREQNG